MQGAVLGLPIRLISRMSGVASGIFGGTAGKVLKYATVAGSMIGSVAPFIKTAFEEPEAVQQGLGGEMLASLVTFMDLNASNVTINDRKRLSIVNVPGRTGDWIQDMGSKSVVYRLKGKFFALDALQAGIQASPLSIVFQSLMGDAAVGNTQLLRQIQKFGVPVPFINRFDIAEVLIANIVLDQEPGRPNWVKYDMTLIEYRRLPTLAKMGALALKHIVDLL